jgi:carboxyl-terminal processing protease
MPRKFFTLPRPSFLFAFTLVLGLGGGVVFDRRVLSAFVPSGSIPPNAVSEFRLMAEAWNTVQRFYVGRSALQPRLLAYGAIDGMVDALGDTGHTAFLPPEMVKQMHRLAKGEFTGIGAEVRMKDGQVVVVAPIDGSPAQQASLRPGDVLLKVDGKEIAKLTLDEVVARISGKKGTPVTLTLLSPQSGRIREVTIVRDAIKIPNVIWQRLPGTTAGHLRIARFHENLTAQLKKALREIEAEKLSGIILDLRSNPGGLLEEAWLRPANSEERQCYCKRTPGQIVPSRFKREQRSICPWSFQSIMEQPVPPVVAEHCKMARACDRRENIRRRNGSARVSPLRWV